MSELFPGFEQRRINAAGVEINCRLAGRGAPLLLLHGYPQTHACWHRIAPALARTWRVVIPDLPGYGDSGFIEPDPANRAYAKRNIAAIMAALMQALGHRRFKLVGHDRGARVSYRLALDRPELVERLALFDIVPTIEAWEGMSGLGSVGEFHWPFLAREGGLPETMIAHDPDSFLRYLLALWAGDVSRIDGRALDEYLRCFRKPSVIRATCADYRAGATTDVADDEADRKAGKRIACPLLVLWGGGRKSDLLPTWRRWAGDVQGEGLACGHFVQEEMPEAATEKLLAFLA